MSAYMTDTTSMYYFGALLARYLRAERRAYHVATILDEVWPYSYVKCEHSQDDHVSVQVERLCRLMLMMNRRAMWHRYALGRDADRRIPPPHWAYTRIRAITNERLSLTTRQRMELSKFMSCTMYQCSEYTEGKRPRALALLDRIEAALALDVLQRTQEWEAAPWGEFSRGVTAV